jgi:hypothetical protein
VTLDTQPVAEQGTPSNTPAALVGGALVAALAFGAFQFVSRLRRRSA